jgi:hypothetical protein
MAIELLRRRTDELVSSPSPPSERARRGEGGGGCRVKLSRVSSRARPLPLPLPLLLLASYFVPLMDASTLCSALRANTTTCCYLAASHPNIWILDSRGVAPVFVCIWTEGVISSPRADY